MGNGHGLAQIGRRLRLGDIGHRLAQIRHRLIQATDKSRSAPRAHHDAPLPGGRAADVEAGEGDAFASAAGLDGLQLVEGLDVDAVEVGLVAHDQHEVIA